MKLFRLTLKSDFHQIYDLHHSFAMMGEAVLDEILSFCATEIFLAVFMACLELEYYFTVCVMVLLYLSFVSCLKQVSGEAAHKFPKEIYR